QLLRARADAPPRPGGGGAQGRVPPLHDRRRGRPRARGAGRPRGMSARHIWVHAGGALDCSRGRLVGILNATPDSFTDGGAHYGTERAVAHGLRLARQGAAVVEVGGESLRFAPTTDPEVEI